MSASWPVRIDDCGPPPSEGDVAALERGLGARLPPDYRAFLLQFNGGRPTPDAVDVPGLHDSPTDVAEFLGVGLPLESSCIEWNLETLAERHDPGVVPIAHDSSGNVFCLSLRDEDFGSVLYSDLDAVFCDYGKKAPLYRVAGAFREFLAALREEP